MQNADSPYVATHDGKFHADDVFAVAALRTLPEFGAMAVRRTRDPGAIAKAAAAVDVGFVHDPAAHRYDHHQREKPTAPEGYPYSAFGLVWASHGPRVVAGLTTAPFDEATAVPLPEHVAAAEKLRLSFVREIDLSDNGLGTQNPADIHESIFALNPEQDGTGGLAAFDYAVSFARQILKGMCRNAVRVARHAARIDAVIDTAKDGVLILDEPLEWRDRVLAHNADNPGREIDFVISPRGDEFTLTSVPVEKGSYESRRLSPPALRGLSETQMAATRGNLDIVFVHANGFFACGKLDALVELAKESVDGNPASATFPP